MKQEWPPQENNSQAVKELDPAKEAKARELVEKKKLLEQITYYVSTGEGGKGDGDKIAKLEGEIAYLEKELREDDKDESQTENGPGVPPSARFSKLYEEIKSGGSINSGIGEKPAEFWIAQIDLFRAGDTEIDNITRTNGLRDKVQTAMLEDLFDELRAQGTIASSLGEKPAEYWIEKIKNARMSGDKKAALKEITSTDGLRAKVARILGVKS